MEVLVGALVGALAEVLTEALVVELVVGLRQVQVPSVAVLVLARVAAAASVLAAEILNPGAHGEHPTCTT